MANWSSNSQGWGGSDRYGLVGKFAGDIGPYKALVNASITPSDEMLSTASALKANEVANWIGNKSKLVASERKTELINDFIKKQEEAQANEQQNDLLGTIGKTVLPIALKAAVAFAGPAAPAVAPIVGAMPIPGLG